ncbi:Putative multidrug export ATP-binding/permease protein [Pontiella sulfatireligans]|uniref:Multidrug export ATP-binding/permease protein n=1 Tax=Pontiella sulfatireligans TaxID=2750658 RepID=A0A6C2UMN0_9BACT|nr:Putative multidrug export ATP-binding/permease protein [Pontiella sulfatireligans]
MLVAVGINLYLPYLMRLVIDGLTEHSLDQAALVRLLATYLGLGVVSVVFSRLLRKIPLKLSHKIEYELRADVFEHLTGLDQEYFRGERTGDLMTRMSSDVNLVRDAIGQGLLQGIRTVAVLVLASIVMALTEPSLALLVVALYLPMVGIFFLILRVMRVRQKDLQEHVSEVSNFSQESFSGIRCIKGFALERRRNAQFEELNSGLIKKTMMMQASRQSLWPFMAFWFCLGMILILNLGGRKIIAGELTLGTLTQFIQYLLYMQWPLLALSWTTSLMQRGKVSWDRIREILDREPKIKHRTSNVEPDEFRSQNMEPQNVEVDGRSPSEFDIPCSTFCGSTSSSIEFHNVGLTIDGREFLHNVFLEIPAGTTLGITGPTGSGKTLLVSLVARLMDATNGAVKVGGTDVRDLPLGQLRGMIGFAAQEPVLFSRTLEHNIGFGVVKPDKDLIGWAAEVAHLRSDVESFPEQYQTMLGERGVTLSGGQRQRTAISRAIARRPGILILDDVLSAVDTQTEAAIMEKLQPVMNERTTLFVSHRISTLHYADEIIVIEDGRITQRGSHAELIRQPGYYAELNTMQQLEEKLEEGS